MRLLIVDDDEIVLDMLEMFLVSEGHEVEIAHDGEEALHQLRHGNIRLVISDWMMPGMDGLQLCEHIRAENFSSYVYVILLTSRSEREDIVSGLSAGADDFISKPFDPSELRVRIKVAQRILSLETRHVAIFALAKLAESRDPETGLHLERMREYARVLAYDVVAQPEYANRLSVDFVETIYLTSPLHDIGKVGIPDCVLLKPGRLTDNEFQTMKMHTTIGGETLSAAIHQYQNIEYLNVASSIATSHHERYNGTGYPAGTAGDEIPLCARIVALADVYDALTSKRVYKAAMAHDVAHSIIEKERGEHFDPLVVDAFFRHEAEFIAIRDRFAEE